MLRAGLARQLGSGLYALTPTGERVKGTLIDHIESEMDAIGGQKISLPALYGEDVWKASGRWGNFEGEMFTFENRDGKQLCLAPSHEEGIVALVDGVVRSYDDLPLLLYQTTAKYRDDHARNGLVRTKEFTMKDAYSLHATEESLEEWYQRVRGAYVRIFEDLDVEFVVTAADNEVMGGSASAEFHAVAETGTVDMRRCTGDGCGFGVTDESPRAGLTAGEDCPECGARLVDSEGIELGHIFKLGTRYSEAMGLTVDAADGTERDVVMGSYGIGIERLMHALVEQHADERGCRWAEDAQSDVAPYQTAIIPLEYDGKIRKTADHLHEACGREETLLFEDADQTIGERFAESDLLGIPWKVVLGSHFRETGEVELETRDGETQFVAVGEVAQIVR
jgi:prolyl-tRNA synthetase